SATRPAATSLATCWRMALWLRPSCSVSSATPTGPPASAMLRKMAWRVGSPSARACSWTVLIAAPPRHRERAGSRLRTAGAGAPSVVDDEADRVDHDARVVEVDVVTAAGRSHLLGVELGRQPVELRLPVVE